LVTSPFAGALSVNVARLHMTRPPTRVVKEMRVALTFTLR
jgi:hypothetical protein